MKFFLSLLFLSLYSNNLFAGYFENLTNKLETKSFNQLKLFFDSLKNDNQNFNFSLNLDRNIIPENFDSRFNFSFISLDSINNTQNYESFQLDLLRLGDAIIYYKLKPIINKGILSSTEFNVFSKLKLGVKDEKSLSRLKTEYEKVFKKDFNLEDVFKEKVYFGLDCFNGQSILSPNFLEKFFNNPDLEWIKNYFKHPLFENKIIALYLCHKLVQKGIDLGDELNEYYLFVLSYKGNIQMCSSSGANTIDFEIFKNSYLN